MLIWILPDYPHNTKAFYLTEEERELVENLDLLQNYEILRSLELLGDNGSPLTEEKK